DALMSEAARREVVVESGSRVVAIDRDADTFIVRLTGDRQMTGRAVVLATGGQSLPKTGSDGFGYRLAERLGHSIVPTTPALAPLLFDADLHAGLSGVAHRATATLRVNGVQQIALDGDWLWTHFGASGPLALNLSRHWHRAELANERVEVFLSV